jgi:hypothetical protein
MRRHDEYTFKSLVIHFLQCMLIIVLISVIFTFIMIIISHPYGYRSNYYSNPIVNFMDDLIYMFRPPPAWWYW